MECVCKLIEENNYSSFMKINVHFDRRECQVKDSRGNRYHIHTRFNTKDISLGELRKIVYYDPNCTFSKEFNTTC